MGHIFGYGMNTASKGITFDCVRVTGLNVANGSLCTIAEDAKAGLVSSVTHTGTGVYTFQLSQPFPPKVVGIQAELSCAAANSAILQARYQDGSYNATTGQFIINVTSSAPAAADGGASNELHVSMAFNRYTR
jgi:hypothetical protein